MKIYTKTGDKGTTGLFGGKRVGKDDLRIESYGTVDELNSFIGLLISKLNDQLLVEKAFLLNVQSRLFDIGASLATDPDSSLKKDYIHHEDIEILEEYIDTYQEQLEPLKNFILPGGSESIALAHVCRAISRRAERRVVALGMDENVEEINIVFLNRLSDYFFVLARYLAHVEGIDDVKWQAKK
ncbi:MAG TPA: cob(I)yrinic acid a,c-diamide adenosyltransferase [Saprospiraceae bacterium]|nr:cob(I)yrinic acid a,c-diamide adenosyltransferase [Saprospiraceae bacterium]HPK09670.1 cob(I)yrinic acid a,c-diamide adenosyltransferase [Saprospiraceae bacterium]HRX29992.1 cob(I)yrinic acid a,c-diamide adenosyltransferase [Saprospiraceae bacterium]